jgi:GrpB-like predicted nucleotidyltransferase (UPF0157 family)
MAELITVVPYSSEWAESFRSERHRLLEAAGSFIDAIEHIGSTSVPGLDAKPIIDVMIGVTEERLFDMAGEERAPIYGAPVTAAGSAEHCRMVQAITALGYTYHGEHGISGRLFFQKAPVRDAHLHLVRREGEFWRINLLFRDYLRTHGDVAAEYAALKRELAERHRNEREAYTRAKAHFIESVIREAERQSS